MTRHSLSGQYYQSHSKTPPRSLLHCALLGTRPETKANHMGIGPRQGNVSSRLRHLGVISNQRQCPSRSLGSLCATCVSESASSPIRRQETPPYDLARTRWMEGYMVPYGTGVSGSSHDCDCCLCFNWIKKTIGQVAPVSWWCLYASKEMYG
jgi:hypothetical protein